ncbi:MAG: hypothetical protein RBT38_09870 [Bacteroidales bacterium]|nr:hypothetical protein [Bacteroidales bacterium]
MKKTIAAIIIFSLSLLHLAGQKPSFSKGDKAFNLGTGIGSNLFSGTYYIPILPPFSVSIETGIKDHILEKGVLGVGAFGAFSSYKFRYSNNGWKTSEVIIGGRGSFHYPFVDDLDTYTGIMAGYGIMSNEFFGSYTEEDYTGSSNGFRWAWFVGARYYFVESMAAFAEIGYGVSYLNAGIAFRF